MASGPDATLQRHSLHRPSLGESGSRCAFERRKYRMRERFPSRRCHFLSLSFLSNDLPSTNLFRINCYLYIFFDANYKSKSCLRACFSPSLVLFAYFLSPLCLATSNSSIIFYLQVKISRLFRLKLPPSCVSITRSRSVVRSPLFETPFVSFLDSDDFY